MRLALLSGANPLISRDGPRVQLARGTWKICYDGLRDSVISLVVNQPLAGIDDQTILWPVPAGHLVKVEQKAIAYVIFQHRGSERFLSVFAEKVA